MKIEIFELERRQSLWEHRVEINLSESGVHPVSLAELYEMGLDRGELEQTRLGYIQTNGSPELRRLLTTLYPGATPANIEVTNGTSEANFLLIHTLLEAGDRLLVQVPNYLQVSGLARHLGADVNCFRLLRREAGWGVDWEGLEAEVAERPGLVYLSQPNNPTGFAFDEEEIGRLLELVERAGAWLLADEVYRGAELDGELSPSFWGRSDRVVITSGLSKALGIPGVRIGWIVAPEGIVADCWARHDYTTIAPGALSDPIARFALSPPIRERLMTRARRMMTRNLERFRDWTAALDGFLEYSEPRAGAYAFARYAADLPSAQLCERIRERQSVLLVAGAWMGLEHHLRFGLGGEPEPFTEGLLRVGLELDRIRTG